MGSDKQTKVLRVLKVDRGKDLCMLEGVPGLGVLKLAFFATSTLDEIFVVGHPDSELTTLTRGRVRGEIQTKLGHITSTSAKIYRGSSGSPVVNVFGSVVGVISEVSRQTNNGYFVPLRHLKSFIGRR